MREFEGILQPLATPFDEAGELDEETLLAIAEHSIAAGVHGFFALGSQGQGLAMRPDQRKRAAELLIKHNKGRVAMVVQVGAVDTQTTVELARHAEASGADAIAVVPAFYYDHGEWEIIAHYRAVAKAVDLPIFIYNNPHFSRIDITPTLAAKIVAELPTIVGMKESYGGLDVILEYIRTLPSHFQVFSGGLHLVPGMYYGVRGAINPPGSMFPDLCARTYELAKAHKYEEALAAQLQANSAIQVLIGYSRKYGRSAYCETLRMQGFNVKRFPRWDTRPMPLEDIDKMRTELEKVGALGVPRSV